MLDFQPRHDEPLRTEAVATALLCGATHPLVNLGGDLTMWNRH
jgi:hypothetical protein